MWGRWSHNRRHHSWTCFHKILKAQKEKCCCQQQQQHQQQQQALGRVITVGFFQIKLRNRVFFCVICLNFDTLQKITP